MSDLSRQMREAREALDALEADQRERFARKPEPKSPARAYLDRLNAARSGTVLSLDSRWLR
jgi:hypothetical protein